MQIGKRRNTKQRWDSMAVKPCMTFEEFKLEELQGNYIQAPKPGRRKK